MSAGERSLSPVEESSPQNTKDWHRISMAAICGAAMLLYAVYLGAFGVMLPELSSEFHLGTAASGRLFPANFGGFVLGVLASGYASDRAGRKSVLLIGTLIYGLGMLLFSQTVTLGMALVAATLVGAGTGGMITVATTLASELYPHKRSTILTVINVAFGIGAAGGPFLAHQLLASGIGWRTLYLGMAAVNGVMFLATLLSRQPSSPAPVIAISSTLVIESRCLEEGRASIEEGRASPTPTMPIRSGKEERTTQAARNSSTFVKSPLRSPEFLLLCLAQALYGGTEVSFFTRLPTYFRSQFAEGAVWEGSVVTIFWLAMTVGRFSLEPVMRRVPLLRLNRVLSAGTALGAILTLLSGTPLLAAIGIALTGLMLSGVLVVILTETGNRFPHATGTVFSGVVASGGIGASLLPWSVSILAATSLGWRGALCLVPLGAMGILLVSWWLEQHPSAETSLFPI